MSFDVPFATLAFIPTYEVKEGMRRAALPQKETCVLDVSEELHISYQMSKAHN